jgi:hypothetical protein
MITFSFTLLWWVVLWWLSYDGHIAIGALGWLSSDKLYCGDWPLVVVTWWLSGGGCLGFLWWLSCHGFPFLPASKLLSCHFCPAIASLHECMVYCEIDKGTKPYFFLYIVKILIRALHYCNKISKYFIPTYQSDSSVRFFYSRFFRGCWAQISRLKGFPLSFCIREVIRIFATAGIPDSPSRL